MANLQQSKHKFRFGAIGECMIEFSRIDEHRYLLGYAGDTFNVAVYFARCSSFHDTEIEYITTVGDDNFSEQMIAYWQTEQIQHHYVQKIPKSLPGLYVIHTDYFGEKQFFYYRSESAAKKLFMTEQTDTLIEALTQFNYLYFSGITLAILEPPALEKLLTLIAKAREKGAKICFDSNYRPRLWKSAEQAQNLFGQFLRHVDIALPSFDDEQLLFQDHNPDQCADRLHSMGISEIVIKQGNKGYLLSTPQSRKMVLVKPVERVVDTTAAGDSFNGVYLAARFQGEQQEVAAQHAAEVASCVIGYRGAIIPIEAMPRLLI